MSQYRKGFNAGYGEGYLIGWLEGEWTLVKHLLERGFAQNYEDAMRFYEIKESNRARLMNYMDFKDAQTWGPLSDEGWEEREKLIRKLMEEKRKSDS